MSVSISTIDYALKQVYTTRDMENAVYKDNPLYALMPKEGGFTGRAHIHGIRYRDSLARSVSFATAQARTASNGVSPASPGGDQGFTRGVQFVVTRQKEYQIYTLEQEAILAGKDDKGSLIRTLTTEVDSALNNLGRSLAIALYGDGSGSLGQLTNVSGTTFTVGEAITNIEVGMELVVSTGSTKTAILRNSGTGCYVTSVNRSAGTFVVNANTDSAATGDWLFIKGDRQVAAITANSQYLKIAGLDAWNPVTTPSGGESFFGIDRSVDATRLAGQRLDISSLQPEEGYITALAAMAREGADPSHIFVSFTDEKNLKLALGARVESEYTQVGDIGFESCKIRGPRGPVRVYADMNAPVGYARLLSLNTWALKYLGDMINTADLDGAKLAREYQADRFEGRLSFYGNVVCYNPDRNMVATLPT